MEFHNNKVTMKNKLINPSHNFDFHLIIQGDAQTTVPIKGDQFLINGKLTYSGRFWKGNKIEGLAVKLEDGPGNI